MRFYSQPHRFYARIDLHARSLYLCVLDANGAVAFHAASDVNVIHVRTTAHECNIGGVWPGPMPRYGSVTGIMRCIVVEPGGYNVRVIWPRRPSDLVGHEW